MQTFWLRFVLFGLVVGGVVPVYGWADPAIHQAMGGHAPSSGSFKFTAFIDFAENSYCTGSLIAPKWKLTTNHCVFHDGSTIPLSAISSISVPGESEDFEYCLGPHHEGTPTRRIAVHPAYLYAGAGFRNNIALIELTSVHRYYSRPQTPVCVLNRHEENRHSPTGTTSTAVGYEGERLAPANSYRQRSTGRAITERTP